jgi:hypothetical protein
MTMCARRIGIGQGLAAAGVAAVSHDGGMLRSGRTLPGAEKIVEDRVERKEKRKEDHHQSPYASYRRPLRRKQHLKLCTFGHSSCQVSELPI